MAEPGHMKGGTHGGHERIDRHRERVDWADFIGRERGLMEYRQAYIDMLVSDARTMRRGRGGGHPGEGLPAIEVGGYSYRDGFEELAKDANEPHDLGTRNLAWQSARSAAEKAYLADPEYRSPKVHEPEPESLNDVAEEGMPEPPAPPQDSEGVSPVESKLSLDVIDGATLQEFDSRVPSRHDKKSTGYESLYLWYQTVFVIELRKVFGQLSEEPAVRSAEMESLRTLFFKHLFRMYMNDYPLKKGTDEEEEYSEDLEKSDWFRDRWNEVLEGTRATLPA